MNQPVEVHITYRGNKFGKEFYDEHPELHGQYPSHDTFMRIYSALHEKAIRSGATQTLVISENSIKVNGIELQSSEIK